MTPSPSNPDPLAEIDYRQDELLRLLDDLNLKLEQVLAEHGRAVTCDGPDALTC